MNTITYYSEADALGTAVGELVRLSLADCVRPADLSAALTVATIRIGLQFASNAGGAFAVVMKAASGVAAEWVTTAKPSNEPDAPAAPIRTTIH
jgi:hypothetical protein